MRHLILPLRIGLSAGALCAVLLVLPSSTALAQPGDRPVATESSVHNARLLRDAAPDAAEKPAYLGMRRCALCHNQNSVRPDPEVSRDFCRMDEDDVFRQHDRHQCAYQALTGELGQTM